MSDIIYEAEAVEVTREEIVRISDSIRSFQQTFAGVNLAMIEAAATRFTDGALGDQEKLLSVVATITKMKKFTEICEKKKGIKEEMNAMMQNVFENQGIKGIKNWESVNISCRSEEVWNFADDKQWNKIFGSIEKEEQKINLLKKQLKSREDVLKEVAKEAPHKAKVKLQSKFYKTYSASVK